jgi:uncharacterized protein
MPITRHLLPALLERSKPYPVVTLTGPRQSGKTTLARLAFKDLPYVNLEDGNTRLFAKTDPKGFLAQYPDGAIFDEVQRLPEILSSVQVVVDEWRFKQLISTRASTRQHNEWGNKKFVLTGSQQLELIDSVRQSLAGRTAVLRLFPLSMSELRGADIRHSTDEIILSGGYPIVHTSPITPTSFYGDYFETYIQRDLRELIELRNIDAFRRMVRLCAGRIGQLVNFNSLANDLGVSQNTVMSWANLLEKGFVIFFLPPWFENIGKRLVKSPKLYFFDTGLAAWLMGIESTKQLSTHPLRGNLFENLVITEFYKHFENAGERARLHFWRDSNGQEVDLLVENAMQPGKLGLVEIKSSQTFHSDFAKSLHKVSNILGPKVERQMIVYGGQETYVREGIEVSSIT